MLGQVIHGYRIDQALSVDKGGFGDVYFATHVDSGAEAVVKVLKPEMSAQRDIVARFFNEARAAASVHHPGVVQIAQDPRAEYFLNLAIADSSSGTSTLLCTPCAKRSDTRRLRNRPT